MLKNWKTPAPAGSRLEALRKEYNDHQQKYWDELDTRTDGLDTDYDTLYAAQMGNLLAAIFEEEKKVFGRIESSLLSN